MAVLSKTIKKKLEHQIRKPQKLVMTLLTKTAEKSWFKISLGKLNWNIWKNILKSLAIWSLSTSDGVLKEGTRNVLQLLFSKRHLQPKRFWIVVVTLSITKEWMSVKYIYNHLNCFPHYRDGPLTKFKCLSVLYNFCKYKLRCDNIYI